MHPDPAPDSAPDTGGDWTLVLFNVYSDRQPGVLIGTGDFRKWRHVPGARWQTFEAACLSAAMHNGKPSTANMGPQHAAERAGAT